MARIETGRSIERVKENEHEHLQLFEEKEMRIKIRDLSQFIVIWLVVLCLAWPATLLAEEQKAKTFKQEELDQILAPIALYPDEILTQIFIAATYPLEVAQAQQWLKQNKNLKGDALQAALKGKTWDASVKAIVAFPNVLTMMSEKLEWTQKTGDAFLAQQKDVMETVQKLRRKAMEAGNLKATKEQTVKKEGDIIIIQPANPQVVYVPTYNPTVVYGTWWYPAYPPYPVYVYPPGAALFTFTMGVAIGAAWHGHNYHSDWHGGSINIDNSININRPGTKPSGGGARAEQWKHNPEHRKGVSYRDNSTRDKYSPANRAGVDNRKDHRGYDKSGVGQGDRAAGKQASQLQDKKSGRSDLGAKSKDNAFGGMDRGAQVNKDSARGRQSMSSTRSRSGFSANRSAGRSRSGGGGRGRR